MPQPYIYNIGQTSISWTIDDLSSAWNSSNYISAYITIDGRSSSPVYPPTSGTSRSTGSGSFSGLSAGTYYTAYGYAVAKNGQTYPAGSTSFRTDSPPRTSTPTGFSMTALNSTSIYFSWNGVGADYYEVSIYSPSSMQKTIFGQTYYTWTGLQPSTTYYAQVRAYTSSGGWSNWSSYAYATTPKGRPTDFSWEVSKSSGNNFNIRASEWNSLTSRINEFRKYKNLSDYTFTTAYSSNNFTATIYNQARNAINGMSPPTSIPAYRGSGEIIYASEINRLRDSLNSIT